MEDWPNGHIATATAPRNPGPDSAKFVAEESAGVDGVHTSRPVEAAIQPRYDVLPPPTKQEEDSDSDSAVTLERCVDGHMLDSSKADLSTPNTISHETQNLIKDEQVGSVGPDVAARSDELSIQTSKPPGRFSIDTALPFQIDGGATIPPVSTSVSTASPTASRLGKSQSGKPSEGSTDKRFLCYICNKLFTRRRSVRDHIKKIHSLNQFDVLRAIEVTVDPATGEPVTPLAELIKAQPTPAARFDSPQVDPNSPSVSSVADSTLQTPAPLTGKKRTSAEIGVAQTAGSKRAITAKAKPVNLNKKALTGLDRSVESPKSFRSPSSTPVSSRASKTPALVKVRGQSTASVASSPIRSDREVEDDNVSIRELGGDAEDSGASDDNEKFCICRKGDNHTWMIGCDGGCEDWFHGKCVDIHERDGELIDKYICPSCEASGQGQTTWKRMCRRAQCRKPARVLEGPPSKYCSDGCRRRFWIGLIRRSDPETITSEDELNILASGAVGNTIDPGKVMDGAGAEAGNKSAVSDGNEPPLSTCGGPLAARDLKMILNQAGTLDQIRQLGQKPPTPPYTSDVEESRDDRNDDTNADESSSDRKRHFQFTADERASLKKVSLQLAELQEQLRTLSDQTKVFSMIKRRSAAIIDSMGVPRAKTICGYDARLSWSRAEFERWRAGASGRHALEIDEIGSPEQGANADIPADIAANPLHRQRPGEGTEAQDDASRDEHEQGASKGNDDYTSANIVNNNDDEDEDDNNNCSGIHQTRTGHPPNHRPDGGGIKSGVGIDICMRNKCSRHRDWRRLLASEYKFEEDLVRKSTRRVEAEGRVIREMAAMRVMCGGG